jgi:hypothetical protein
MITILVNKNFFEFFDNVESIYFLFWKLIYKKNP